MFRNETEKPHLVDNPFVAVIEKRIEETTELMTVYTLLFEDVVPDHQINTLWW